MNGWLLAALLLAQGNDQGWMSAFWEFEPGMRFALLVVTIGCATGVVCTIVACTANTISSIHGRRLDAELKREMIERGLSAGEIVEILEAASPPQDATQRWIASWPKPKRRILGKQT